MFSIGNGEEASISIGYVSMMRQTLEEMCYLVSRKRQSMIYGTAVVRIAGVK